ncbi:MAG TPA: SMC-Scp complex subunit ScpB [Pirellulales bacterium]|nr:SMC-Scp complex subunit ScpB [Pirellulales bacterium]
MPSPEKDFKVSRPADASESDLQPPQPPALDAGLSLEDLNAAFAGMMSGGHDPYSEAPPATMDPSASEILDAAAAGAERDDDACCEITPATILEAMLFVGSAAGEPLSSQQVAGMMRGVRPTEIDDLVRDLNERYQADGRPYCIENRGRGYRLALREQFAPLVDKFYGRNRQARLSAGAIEVLSLIAYNRAETADELARLRGRPSGAILSQLVRRQLLRIERDANDRRLVRYYTTPRFLALLGVQSLDDLPRSQDVERR